MIAPVLTVYNRMRLTMLFHLLELNNEYNGLVIQGPLCSHPVYAG